MSSQPNLRPWGALGEGREVRGGSAFAGGVVLIGFLFRGSWEACVGDFARLSERSCDATES